MKLQSILTLPSFSFQSKNLPKAPMKIQKNQIGIFSKKLAENIKNYFKNIP